MKAIHGIQMIGTQRSGSNLLRVILDQSPDIVSPHPAHVLVNFRPLLNLYEPLSDRENYNRLVSDVVDYVNANPVPWDGVVFNKDEIISRSTNNSLFELNKLIYETAAEWKNATMWCCKSMNNVYFSSELETHGSIKKYIYLYRDGRDVAASFKKAIVGEKHIYFLAKQWKQDQEECLKLRGTIPADRFFSLNYESLIQNPEKTIQELCNFLNITFSENMLQYYTSQTSKITAASGEMWKNLEKPIMTNNTGNYLKSFEKNDLDIFELIAGDTLTKLGYTLHSPAPDKGLISADNIERYRSENTDLKKECQLNAKEHDIEKRKPQEQLLKEIKERVLA
ncbi:sulfotransferase [Mucilaginibacter sp. L196]|uniref:sulfotransferase family protein n=1 Tax=Mucilaginibacter sp. L196 TaxID=1641870 RepID=UPI00131D87A2|nr:sulfotransferase [Mucilaginibacter sp. L196]